MGVKNPIRWELRGIKIPGVKIMGGNISWGQKYRGKYSWAEKYVGKNSWGENNGEGKKYEGQKFLVWKL